MSGLSPTQSSMQSDRHRCTLRRMCSRRRVVYCGCESKDVIDPEKDDRSKSMLKLNTVPDNSTGMRLAVPGLLPRLSTPIQSIWIGMFLLDS